MSMQRDDLIVVYGGDPAAMAREALAAARIEELILPDGIAVTRFLESLARGGEN